MERSGTGPRLIIVCGLPGSGKTTHAKLLEARLGAIRFSPDEWLEALSLDLYDEGSREKIEALQWKLGSGTSRAWSHRNHRMGHLGKVRAGYIATRSPSPWRCC